MSTEGEFSSKAVRRRALSEARCLGYIPVPRRRVVENEEVKLMHLVMVRAFEGGAVLPLVWENPDVVGYVRLDARYLNARMLGAVFSHRRASKAFYAKRSRATVYGTWRLRQNEWRAVKKHAQEGMNMAVLRQDCEAANVTKLSRLAQNVKVGRRLDDWLRYCMLRWPHHMLLFLDESKVCCNATNFESCNWTESESPILVGWHN